MSINFQNIRTVTGLPGRRIAWPTRAGLLAGGLTALLPLLLAIAAGLIVGLVVLTVSRLVSRLLQVLGLEPPPDAQTPFQNPTEPERENVRVRGM